MNANHHGRVNDENGKGKGGEDSQHQQNLNETQAEISVRGHGVLRIK
jgi:hypothetical protein